MKKILSIILSLCMIISMCTSFTAMTSWAVIAGDLEEGTDMDFDIEIESAEPGIFKSDEFNPFYDKEAGTLAELENIRAAVTWGWEHKDDPEIAENKEANKPTLSGDLAKAFDNVAGIDASHHVTINNAAAAEYRNIDGEQWRKSYITVDMGEDKTFSAIRVYGRMREKDGEILVYNGTDTASENMSAGYIYVSDDGNNWIQADKLAFAANQHLNIAQEIPTTFDGTQYNITARYIRVEATQISYYESVGQGPDPWSFTEIRLVNPDGNLTTKTASQLASFSEITSGDTVSIDISNAPAITVDEITFTEGASVTKIEVEDAALTVGTDYTVADNKITFTNTYLASLTVGEYECVVTFESGDTSTITLSVESVDYYTADPYIDLSRTTVGAAAGNTTSAAAANLFDGKVGSGEGETIYNSGWHSPNGTGATGDELLAKKTITVMFNDEISVGGLRFYPRYNSPAVGPRDMKITGIYDDGNGGTEERYIGNARIYYISYDYKTNANITTNHPKSVYFNNPEDLLGIKVAIINTNNGGLSEDYVCISELEILKPKARENWPSSELLSNFMTDDYNPFVAGDSFYPATNPVITLAGGTEQTNNKLIYAFDNVYGQSSYQFAEINNATSPSLTIDLGEDMTFSGVRVYGRTYWNGSRWVVFSNGQGHQNMTKGNLYVSETGEDGSWIKVSAYEGAAGDFTQSMYTSFNETDYNITARYIKIEATDIMGAPASNTNWSLSEIRLINEDESLDEKTPTQLANLPRITNEGDISVDAENVAAKDVNLSVAATNVTSVKVDEAALTETTDYIKEGNKIVLNESYLSSLEVGTYELKVTFSTGDEATIGVVVSNPTVLEFKYIYKNGSSLASTGDLTFTNVQGVPVTSIKLKADETKTFTFTNGEGNETFKITRNDFRTAFDSYEDMGLESFTHELLVAFDGAETVTYKVKVSADWISISDFLTISNNLSGRAPKTFADDEYDVNDFANFKVRNESAWNNNWIHYVMSAFLAAPIDASDVQNYHASPAEGRFHYIEVDFGEETLVDGLRYQARKVGANYSPDWNHIIIYGAKEYGTWTKLFENTNGQYVNQQKINNLMFNYTDSVGNEVRYIRIYMRGVNPHTTADGLTFLKPTTRIMGDVKYSKGLPELETDVVAKFITYPAGNELTKVEIDGAEVPSANYTVGEGKVTIDKEYADDFEMGEYPFVLTFANGDTAEATFKVADVLSVEFKYSSQNGGAITRTETMTFTNVKGSAVTSVKLKADETKTIPFTNGAENETFTIGRSAFRSAFDTYAAMGKDGGKHEIIVSFESGEPVTYTIKMTGGWFNKTSFLTTSGVSTGDLKTFAEDEINIFDFADFAVRTDSAWNNSWKNHVQAAFFYKRPGEAQEGYNYHASTDEGNLHYIDVDFGEETLVDGVRYQARYTSNYHPDWSNIKIYGSTDFENWTLLFDAPGTTYVNSKRINEFKFNFTDSVGNEVRYIRIHMKGVNPHTTGASLTFLKPTTRIVEDLNYETSTPADVVAKFITYPAGNELTKVEIDGAEVPSANYEISEGRVTIDKEYFAEFEVGEYPVELTFENGDVAEAILKVVNVYYADFKFPTFISEAGIQRTETIELTNVKGLPVTKIVLKADGTNIPYTSDLETITIRCTDIRQAFDVYKNLGAETTKHQILVQYEGGSYDIFTILVSGGWAKKVNSIDAASPSDFKTDEIDIITNYPEFGVRTEAVWSGSQSYHPVNAFFRALAADRVEATRWHGEAGHSEGTKHYIDIDFGSTATVGGLRYYARWVNSAGYYQANWNNVVISGSTDCENWEVLYEGKAQGNSATKRMYDMVFNKNAEVRYIRIYLNGATYYHASNIRLLKPSLKVYNEYGGVVTSLTLNKSDNAEEVKLVTSLPVTGLKVGGTAKTYTFDDETMLLTIPATSLSAIKTAGTATTIEIIAGSESKVLDVNFGTKLFTQEVLPYNFANTVTMAVGRVTQGSIGTIIDRGISKKTNGSAISNSENADLAIDQITRASAIDVRGDMTLGKHGIIEIDYQIPHTFSGIRVYYKLWASSGSRQFGQAMVKAKLQVSNDGVNWLTSDNWNAELDDGFNKNAYDDIKFMIDGEEVNVEARYVRLCILPSSYDSVVGIEEICLYEPGSGRTLTPAEVIYDGEKSLYSLSDEKDMTFGVNYNDAVALAGITVVKEGQEDLIIDSSYINTQGETIVITENFFKDNLATLSETGRFAGEFDLLFSFVLGEDVTVPSGMVAEETHTVTFNVAEGHEDKVSVTAKNVNKTTDPETVRPIESGEAAKRHEDVILTAELADGYEAVWEIEENKVTTVVSEPLKYTEDWTLRYDGWKSWEVKYAFDHTTSTSVSSDTPGNGGSHDAMNEDLTITAEFGRTVTLNGLSWQQKYDYRGGNHSIHTWAYSWGVRNYKIYAVRNGNIEEVIAEGHLADNAYLQPLTFAGDVSEVTLDGVHIWVEHGQANYFIGDVNLFEKVEKVKDLAVTGEVVRVGSSSEDFKITDLYSDATVTVSTKPIAAGKVNVTTDLVGLTSNAPSKANKGEGLEVTLAAKEGNTLPVALTEVSQDGVALVAGLDYDYAAGVITINNVRGDINIVADAEGITRYKVSYVDDMGAKGTVPASTFHQDGEEVTIPTSSLKLSGYTFKGWNYTGEALEEGEEHTLYEKGDIFDMPASDVTFKAVWEVKESTNPQRPVTGGGAADDDDDEKESFGGGAGGGLASNVFTVVISGEGTKKVAIGTILEAPKVAEGYEFAGWYLDAAYTVPFANKGVTSDITVYPLVRRIRLATELSDIQSHWAKDYINKLYIAYMVNGNTETTFAPDIDITRAEFCQILYKISGQTSDGSENFTDVNVGDWFANAVAWAVNNGITMGTTDTTFSPYAKITREQMATMIYRYATLVGAEWTILAEAGFIDKAEISTYANYQVNWAAEKGIITGYPDGSFAPKAEATRAEAVVMLTRLMTLLGK